MGSKVACIFFLLFVTYFMSLSFKRVEATIDRDPTVDTDLKAEKHPLKTDDDVVNREEQALSEDGFSVAELKELTRNAEKHEFQAEVNKLMGLIINSLYSNKEVFLREVISNASDALDKIRFLSLTDKTQIGEGDLTRLDIRIKADKEAGTLTITDKGIGMTKEELITNLGTIAKSGTKEFVEKLVQGADSNLIGQFGVGFYSYFLVADRVVVQTKHNKDKQLVWESTANTTFSVAEDPHGNTLGRGTKVTLFMKEDAKYLLEDDTVKALATKYSEFINFPIYIWTTKTVEKEASAESSTEKKPEETEEDVKISEEEEEEEKQEETKKVTETISEWTMINETKPIWTRKTSEITQEEYNAFYKALTKETQEPLAHIHFSAEGDIDFKSILYIPKAAPVNMFEDRGKQGGIKLYVRRVFITDKFDDLLPRYLSFIRGIVDSDDLPLNVSREILQQDKTLHIIKKKLVRKAIAMLQTLATEDEAKFKEFFTQYGVNIKLGVTEDKENQARLSKLLMFTSSKTGELTKFENYVERFKEGQEDIYYLAGESKDGVEKSPLAERLIRRGYEVLYMVDPIDEYMMQSLHKYDNKYKFVNIAREGLKLPGNDEDEEKLKETSEDFKPLTEFLKQTLGNQVEKSNCNKPLIKVSIRVSFGTVGIYC